MANITRLKSDLANIVEPDFGLLDQLVSREVLNLRQLSEVCSEKTVYRRNDALLDLLQTQDQCDKFLTALQQTDQLHVSNLITQNGGQTHYVERAIFLIQPELIWNLNLSTAIVFVFVFDIGYIWSLLFVNRVNNYTVSFTD